MARSGSRGLQGALAMTLYLLAALVAWDPGFSDAPLTSVTMHIWNLCGLSLCKVPSAVPPVHSNSRAPIATGHCHASSGWCRGWDTALFH